MKHLLALTLLLSLGLHAKADNQIKWYDGSHAISISLSNKVLPVVGVAKDMLCNDLLQVTGKAVVNSTNSKNATIRVIELNTDRSQDKALKSMGISVDSIRGLKDGFLLKAIDNGDGTAQILVVGADGRGTAYGLLEVSRLAGVSPWIWWQDVKPQHKDALYINKVYETCQSPSVEYRGIFINDEDWSLQPWASMTFDKQKPGMISANAYRQIFKLLLRLRGNMIWPGMHGLTVPFYKVPGAKECADSCGITIGTSHCEPLMRNNVGEWDVDKRGRYNFISNHDAVIDYWSERLKEAGKYENFYTIGMRGVHDGEMEGVKTKKEKVDALNKVIKEQRELLTKYVINDPVARKIRGYKRIEDIPQVFVPYKEVLQVMEAGVNVPDDVTLMWCDDNYGYMTRLSDTLQQKRSGGAGVYYHLSYWGRPHDWMWLTTLQPGLIYSEMKAAYDHNARKSWIVNVHDLKAPCYDLELFMDMAWNINGVKRASINGREEINLNDHLQGWLCREFGDEAGKQLLPVMLEYYRLTSIRKPEHMGWCQTELDKKTYERGNSPVHNTEFSFTEFPDVKVFSGVSEPTDNQVSIGVSESTDNQVSIGVSESTDNQVSIGVSESTDNQVSIGVSDGKGAQCKGEAQRYLSDYATIRAKAEEIGKTVIPQDLQDAYFAHILYPVSAAAYMAEKMLYAQKARQIAAGDYHAERWQRSPKLEIACANSQYAYQQIRRLTDYYNNELAGGKWKYAMCYNPRDLYVFWAPSLPIALSDAEVQKYHIATPLRPSVFDATSRINGDSFIARDAADYDASTTATPQLIQNLGHSQRAITLPKGGEVSYTINTGKEGDCLLTLCLIPTQANDKGDIRIAARMDGESKTFSLKEPFRSETWKTNVLRGQARFTMPVKLSKGKHTLAIQALDDHIILDQWMLDFKPDRKYYVIPTK